MCNVIGEDPEDPDKLAEDLIENARTGMGKFETEGEDGI